MKKIIIYAIFAAFLFTSCGLPLEPNYSEDGDGSFDDNAFQFEITFDNYSNENDQKFLPMKIEVKRTDLPQYIYIGAITKEGYDGELKSEYFSTGYKYEVRATINNLDSPLIGYFVKQNVSVSISFNVSTYFRDSDFEDIEIDIDFEYEYDDLYNSGDYLPMIIVIERANSNLYAGSITKAGWGNGLTKHLPRLYEYETVKATINNPNSPLNGATSTKPYLEKTINWYTFYSSDFTM